MNVERTMLWVRWSWRDLRARWLQVGAIALVIALGTGTFAGLSSTANWRENSADQSYAALGMFDLRVRTAEGAVVERGSLLAAAHQVRAGPGVARAEERLILPAQVDASTDKQTILVPGLLVGVDLSGGGPHIAGLHVAEGGGLTAADAGRPVALLEHNFGRHYNLPAAGTLRTRGGATLAYRGHALTPEYFIVTTERGGMLAEANFAAIFTSIETVEELSGAPGVNDLVLTFEPAADATAVRTELEAALADALPGVGFTFVEQHEDPAHRLIYEDIEGDRRTQRVFALLVLAGASAAAFNLITRIVDSQRREVGVAMALGVAPARIAIRPLLVGAQVALLGVVFGLAVGFGVGSLMAAVVQDFFPLPIWDTPFQYGEFGRAAVLGFALPFVATIIPVVQAVRVTPLRALQSGYRAARGGGLAPVLRRLPLPGSTLVRMPIRNVVRAPRRSLLTGVGIAAAITILVAFAGMVDSFSATVDRGEREVLSRNADRMEVDFASFVPANGPQVESIAALAGVVRVEPALRLGGTIRGTPDIGIRLEVMNLANDVWTPTITRGRLELETPGIYISEVAAADLEVSPGEVVTVVHPRLEMGSLRLVESQLPVLGLHPHPFRFVAYIHSGHAGLMGLAGAANFTWAVPAEGTTRQDLQRELFELDEVVSAQTAGTLITAFRDLLDEFVVIIRIVEGIILVLALLVAFNSASINIDERRREHATMFAFGVPVRRALGIGIAENFILGLGSTLAGVLAGWLVLRWVLEYLIADTMPDLELATALSGGTYAIAIGLGVLAVAAAPLLTWRKLRRMDIPSALKFQE